MNFRKYQTVIKSNPILKAAAYLPWNTYKFFRVLQYYFFANPMTVRTNQEKRDHIAYWQRITGYKLFVETGTYLGKTTLAMSELFETCFTVEFDQKLYEAAVEKFRDRINIIIYQGDSAVIMPKILEQVDKPAVFWLDAHYSGGPTGLASLDSPILNELERIFAHHIKLHIILIDDARDFMGHNGYPTIKKLHNFVMSHGNYELRILDDIIRIYPADLID